MRNLHGLRHTYAQDRYSQLTGWECSHRGGLKYKEISTRQKEMSLSRSKCLTDVLNKLLLTSINFYRYRARYSSLLKSRGLTMKKETMNKETLYQLLIDQKNELSQRIEKIEADLKNRYVNSRSSQKAVDHSNDDVLGGLKNEAQTKLDLTDEALQRLTRGEFGHCIKCNTEINNERLNALPHAQLCRVCAQKEEGSAKPFSKASSMSHV